MTVFERIENLRKQKNISQGKLEKELGFSNGSISKWRTSMPKPERLQKISEYFGVSLEYLMTGEEQEGGEKYYFNEETTDIAEKILHNKELKLLFDAAQDAEPEDLSTVHQMLLALKRKERGETD